KYVCYKCLSYHGDSSCFSAHQNLHMQVEPYICPDCHINFINAKFLEIHIWTACFHTLKKRVFSCKVCKIDGFRDIESITIHFATMHSDKKVVCEMCCLVFSLYDDYMKHYAM
ncbi:Zinc finger protein 687, partial [Harpegnathos saltator]